jgi:hypothetical protein
LTNSREKNDLEAKWENVENNDLSVQDKNNNFDSKACIKINKIHNIDKYKVLTHRISEVKAILT